MFHYDDQVQVVSRVPADATDPLSPGWNPEMSRLLGKQGRITAVYDGARPHTYKIKVDGVNCPWLWAEHWLTRAMPDVDAVFARKRDENLRSYFDGWFS